VRSNTIDKSQIKCVAVIQCDHALDRKNSALYALEFLRRENVFQDYPDDVIFVASSCGGCPGKSLPGLARQLERLTRSVEDMSGDRIVVHLAAHKQEHSCAHREYIKQLILHQGLSCVENDLPE
jgi:predicted metal-binding protein